MTDRIRTRLSHRGLGLVALFSAELVALALAYQLLATVDCGSSGAYEACRFLRSLVARALTLFFLLGLLLKARPALFSELVAAAATTRESRWALMHGAGVVLLLAPVLIWGGRDLTPVFGAAVPFWVLGSLLAAGGGLLLLAPVAAWRRFLQGGGWILRVVLVAGFVLPDLALLVQPLWYDSILTDATFTASAVLLLLAGQDVFVDPGAYVLGIGSFAVEVSDQCSGIEGVALVTAFTFVYGFLFRHDLRHGRFWVTVLPLALAASWLLNAVRIAVLVWIGAEVSPDLAVNGFHSYAGWLFFTILALGLLVLVDRIGWLHRGTVAVTTRAPSLPLGADPVAAALIPALVFFLGALILQTTHQVPALGYPWLALAMATSIWFFRRPLLALEWRVDPVAVGVGALIAALWLGFGREGATSGASVNDALALLSTGGLVLWVVARVIGTSILVPIIEEALFRGYVFSRLDRGGMGWRIAALAVSTGLFAALHGRWVLAAIAGLAFAFVMLRRKRLADAMVAHGVANAIIALWAMIEGDWSLI